MLVSSFLLDVPCRRARPAWLARPTAHPAPSAPPSERTAAKIAARWLWVVGVGEELRQTPNRPALRCGAVLWAIGHEAGCGVGGGVAVGAPALLSPPPWVRG